MWDGARNHSRFPHSWQYLRIFCISIWEPLLQYFLIFVLVAKAGCFFPPRFYSLYFRLFLVLDHKPDLFWFDIGIRPSKTFSSFIYLLRKYPVLLRSLDTQFRRHHTKSWFRVTLIDKPWFQDDQNQKQWVELPLQALFCTSYVCPAVWIEKLQRHHHFS